MKALFQAIFLLLWAQCSFSQNTVTTANERKSETNSVQAVVTLNAGNFDKAVSDGSIWLIEFYAPVSARRMNRHLEKYICS